MTSSQLTRAFEAQLEALADLRNRIPPMVLIYPIDQTYLKSMIVRRKWMLKLCCMAPGEEHILDDKEAQNGQTRPDLGWYCLKDFGILTGPIFRWAKKRQAVIKLISTRLGDFLDSVHGDSLKSFVKQIGKGAADIPLPEGHLSSGLERNLLSSDLIRLSGLKEKDYKILDGQELIFLEKVFDQHQRCGNLRLFVRSNQRLWLCNEHFDALKAQWTVEEAVRRDELFTKYLQKVEKQVGTVRILGDSVPRNLDKVFFELTVTNDRKWPSSQTQAEYMGLMDAELRRRRNPLEREYGEGQARAPKGRLVHPEALLNDHRRAVLVGAPGSGKSTLLRYLAYKTLGQQQSLPVFLELKSLSKGTFDSAQGKLTDLVFLATIDRWVCQSESDRAVMQDEFFKRLQQGQVSIFLDGLDEVSAKDFFTSLRQSVKEFLQDDDYKDVRLYISTRPYAFKDRFSRDEAAEMEIEPLNQEQIERFISYYYPNDAEAAKLLVEIKKRPELRELARVPALLGFLLVLYRRQGSAPSNRIELYDEIMHVLVSQWDQEKGVERAFRTSEPRRRDFLSHLAFTSLLGSSEKPISHSLVFSGQEILAEAERYCQSKHIPDKADSLADDVRATPLLNQIGADSYAFAHLTIQEYLAATTLATNKDCVRLFSRAYFDATLSELEVLPITLVMAEQGKVLFEVLGELSESLDYKKLRLQARSLRYGSVPEGVLAALVQALKQMVTEEEIEFGYSGAVVKSFRGASGYAAEAIAKAVAAELNNEAAVYRRIAVRILGLLENEAATRLLNAVLKDADASVRVEAALFISLNDNGSAIESLIEELKSQDSEIKEAVIYALWQIGTERAIEDLKKGSEDKDKFVRKLSLEALASLTGEAAVPMLIDHLDDPDEWVRRGVVAELGEIGGEAVIDALMKGADDSDFYVAEDSLKWLGRTSSELSFDFLLGFIEKHSGKIVGPAAEALGRMKNAAAIPKLFEVLEKYRPNEADTKPLPYLTGGWIKDYVRVRAAASLAQLGDERGRSVLLDALEGRESGERKYAAYALRKLDGAAAEPILFKALNDAKDEREKIALANLLLDLNVDDQEPIVRAMLSILNTHKGYRDSRITGAINVLGQTKGDDAIKGLIAALENSDPTVQLAAIVALGNIATESNLAVEGLLTRLIGFNAVSEEAARVLARISNPILVSGLDLCLHSDWKYVRRKAAQSIAYYSSEEATHAALSVLAQNDPAPRVRTVAQGALSQIEQRRWATARFAAAN